MEPTHRGPERTGWLHPVVVPVGHGWANRTPGQVQAQRQTAHRALGRAARLAGAPNEGWTQEDTGVPRPNGSWYWSVTHKRGFAGAVVAEGPVGLDVEQLTPRAGTNLWKVIAGPHEWSVLGEQTWESFFRIWTAKEALLKRVGKGIGDLPDCRVVHARPLVFPTVRCGCRGYSTGFVRRSESTATGTIHLQYQDQTFPVHQLRIHGYLVALAGEALAISWTFLALDHTFDTGSPDASTPRILGASLD